MRPNERLRRLRKEFLDLTQEEFAKQIKVSTSNIGSLEIGRINLTDRVVSDICREFSVNKDWLLEGTEPVFAESDRTSVNRVLEIYRNLDDDNRKYLYGYAARLLEEQNAAKE
jgi:transcriptional regulator with XRE-family HTH domain